MPSVLVFYHYFHPDDVVSAQHYADLCSGLEARGWDVTVMPCNRGCRDERQRFPPREDWKRVRIRRIWRPAFPQASFLGRILNAAWMILAWSLAALRHRPDVLFIGTDPIFSVLAALPWKWIRPSTRIVHWCFDLHPEAAIADGIMSARAPLVRLLQGLLRRAYRRCDLIGSLGPCMTRLLRAHDEALPIETFTPWALAEPPAPLDADPEEREAIFGPASLALMYSGSFGNAHTYEEILALARSLRGADVHFAFSIRGNRAKEVETAVAGDDENISFVDFAPQERLERRLGAADIQVVSLRTSYAGTVVPSKFQGALATGRPILFAGPPDSAVGRWITEFGLGWTLDGGNSADVARDLQRVQADPTARKALQDRCFKVYQERFSRTAILDRMDRAMRGLLPGQPG